MNLLRWCHKFDQSQHTFLMMVLGYIFISSLFLVTLTNFRWWHPELWWESMDDSKTSSRKINSPYQQKIRPTMKRKLLQEQVNTWDYLVKGVWSSRLYKYVYINIFPYDISHLFEDWKVTSYLHPYSWDNGLLEL